MRKLQLEPEIVPFREVGFISRDIDVDRRPDGVILLKSRHALRTQADHLPAYLRRHAAERPDQPWLSQRRGPERLWLTVTFGQAMRIVDSLTQGLLDLGADSGPLVVLSGNSIEHALITLAAMQARIPVAPISPSYGLLSTDFAKLREMIALLQPGFVFVQDGEAFSRALDAVDLGQAAVIWADKPSGDRNAISYERLASTRAGGDVARSVAAIDPDAVAKYMFTSGSTGAPKAVMQTQRNLCGALDMQLQTFGDTPEKAMVRLDWSPWNHVFGAMSLGQTLGIGGAFYIDDGRPVGPAFAETIRNLREISTTSYANVPVGYAALAPLLEQDAALAERFFAKLEMMAYAGARLADDVAARLQAVAIRVTGRRIPFVAGFGCTETGPSGAFVHWPTDRVGFVGLPSPGVEMKLVPVDEARYDVRIRSVGVTPGYYRRPDLTAEAFDADGFYVMGDAATFVDPEDPAEGLVFAGRLAEEFKLQTGTFVRVGALRAQLVDAAPLLRDAVICGQDEAFVGILAWLDLEAARRLVGQPDATIESLNASETVRSVLREALAAHNAAHPGSSTAVGRVLLLAEPPSIDRGEITDKGSINQRAVQRFRADLVAALFKTEPPTTVIDLLAAAPAASSKSQA